MLYSNVTNFFDGSKCWPMSSKMKKKELICFYCIMLGIRCLERVNNKAFLRKIDTKIDIYKNKKNKDGISTTHNKGLVNLTVIGHIESKKDRGKQQIRALKILCKWLAEPGIRRNCNGTHLTEN